MSEFYSPYNFIPVKAPVSKNKKYDESYSFNNIIDKNNHDSHVRHDYWKPQTHSGRVLCKIDLLSPTFVGNQQTKGDIIKDDKGKEIERTPSHSEHYRVNGELGLPANSIRGMLASIVEPLSQSALRVLADEYYSERMSIGESLSAIGLVVAGNDGELRLQPLTLPTFRADKYNEQLKKWMQIYSSTDEQRPTLGEFLPVRIGEKQDRKNSNINTFLASHDSFSGSHNREYVYLKGLNKDLLDKGIPESFDELIAMEKRLHIPSRERKYKKHKSEFETIVGQTVKYGHENDLIDKETYYKSETNKEDYTRGMLFILRNSNNQKNLPSTKIHEIFIPMPERNGKDKQAILQSIAILPEALDTYERIATSRATREQADTQDDFPYLPKGYSHPNSENNKPIRKIQRGDLVYFDIKDNKVSKISYSATWRKELKNTTHEFFEKVDKNTLPWGKGRTQLTAAEAIFGVVDSAPIGESKNLASRIRFSDAMGEGVTLDEEVILKKLAAPKAPSPQMYKTKDKNLKGRKAYIPYPEAQTSTKPWKTKPKDSEQDKGLNQHTKLSPLKQGSTLYFHIDFNNLDSAELILVLTALQPSASFIHRIGRGKPLGLGQIKLTPCSLNLCDRSQRYSASGISTPRYHHRWKLLSDDANAQNHTSFLLPETLPKKYAEELPTTSSSEPLTQYLGYGDINLFALIDDETLAMVQQLGNREALKEDVWVSYPFTDDQRADKNSSNSTSVWNEEKGFKWFVSNNHRQNVTQHLAPPTAREADNIPLFSQPSEPSVQPKLVPLSTPIECGNQKSKHGQPATKNTTKNTTKSTTINNEVKFIFDVFDENLNEEQIKSSEQLVAEWFKQHDINIKVQAKRKKHGSFTGEMIVTAKASEAQSIDKLAEDDIILDGDIFYIERE